MGAGRTVTLLLAVTTTLGCGASAVGHVRFKNQPTVTVVNDRQDVRVKPDERRFAHLLYFFDAFVLRQLTNAMDMETPRRAENVNSRGEVPNSTWFTNRIGTRKITPDEMRRGPNVDDGPVGPYTVVGTKVGGKSTGFIMKDSRGEKYIMKFDAKGFPVMETAADVVMQRILWAIGYYVPQDSVFYFTRTELVLDPNAKISDVFGNKTPMTMTDLEASLKLVNQSADGRYRALASKFISGIPIGGFPMRGVREDDLNDRIAHENRREIRGLYAIFGWLQATDVKEDNTLDVWAEDTQDKGHHYVVHYLVDFGKSLGVNGTIPKYSRDGHEPRIDLGSLFTSFFALGLRKRPWEGMRDVSIGGVGRMDVDHFAPGGYSPQQPYRPFEVKDKFDMLWATRLVLRLSPPMIRAAVEQGKYEDPAAVDHLTKVLLGRQRRLGAYWLARVNPLTDFVVDATDGENALCFTDLFVHHKFSRAVAAQSSWSATLYDHAGAKQKWQQIASGPRKEGQTACFIGVPKAPGEAGYTIVRVVTHRGNRQLAAVEVHLANAPNGGATRIVGIERH